MKSRVVLVTGAGSGIGLATATRFAREGCQVIMADINDTAEQAAKIGAEHDTSPLSYQVDVSSEESVTALFDFISHGPGPIDVLVANAGVNRRTTIENATMDDFDYIVGVNLKGVFLCARAAIPQMKSKGGGAIVNVASELAFVSGPELGIYCASKGGVLQLTRSLAVDHTADNIRVNCVCPGPVDTPLIQTGINAAKDPVKQVSTIEASTLLGRMGRPDEIANVIYFLASEEASFMCGSAVIADGGVTAT